MVSVAQAGADQTAPVPGPALTADSPPLEVGGGAEAEGVVGQVHALPLVRSVRAVVQSVAQGGDGDTAATLLTQHLQ